jgi:ATP-binding cassette subfamily F protein 3
MLLVHDVSKSFGHEKVLEGIGFSVNEGERVGLISTNGCGKTTLLRIIIGEEDSDSGTVAFSPRDLRIGYLEQGLSLPQESTLGEVLHPQTRELAEVEARVAELSERIAVSVTDDRRALEQEYDLALQRLVELTRQEHARQASHVIERLGLADLPMSMRVSELSGGQKTRLGLGRVLMQNPQLLLLDEPTNHLDIEMLEWLESWLLHFDGAALLVSHDRTFLDHTVKCILYLDPEDHSIRSYAGNYSDYVQQSQIEQEKQQTAYRDQVYEIRKMKQDIARVKEQARSVERDTTDSSQRRYAKKVARKAVSREKKLNRYLKSDERVRKPKRSWRMKLDFGTPSKMGKHILVADRLAIGYPGHEALLKDVRLEVQSDSRIAVTGPNGTGKTTLLRTIAGHLEPLAGKFDLSESVRLGYMSQEQELLQPQQSALETIRGVSPMSETDARSFLHYFLFSGDDPLKPVMDLSFGERARLELALLVAQDRNLFLLDEPINHLDIASRESFEMTLTHLEGAVIAVVHDRYFIERFANELWIVDHGSVRRQHLKSF